MNFRRKHPRHGHTARELSSDYVYPEIEKGSSERARASARRWLEKATASFKEWKDSAQP